MANTQRYNVLRGGAGSGKSVAACQKIALRMVSEPGHRFLVIRKVATTLRDSVWRLFQEVVGSGINGQGGLGLADEFRINKSDFSITHLPSGSEVLFKGLDDSEKIKSIQGITGIWVEEATETEERDFNQLELRVRGETPYYKQFILTFNPIDEGHWLKARFFDTPDPEVFSLSTSYMDNYFLDPDYIRHLSERLRANENYYRIYVLGEWGKAASGGEFYKQFLFSRHIGHSSYEPQLPLHISFDFNVNPHMTCTIWQIRDKNCTQLREICLPSPRNTTVATCREIIRLYQGHKAGMFIYGDPAGRHQDTRSEKGFNDYVIIRRELEAFRPTERVASKAPPVALRGNFINSILEGEYGGISILIDEQCRHTIADYNNLKEAPDGSKLKEKTRHPDTGITYEKYGHCSDANDYFLCTAFSREFDQYQQGVIPGRPYISGERFYRKENRL